MLYFKENARSSYIAFYKAQLSDASKIDVHPFVLLRTSHVYIVSWISCLPILSLMSPVNFFLGE